MSGDYDLSDPGRFRDHVQGLLDPARCYFDGCEGRLCWDQGGVIRCEACGRTQGGVMVRPPTVAESLRALSDALGELRRALLREARADWEVYWEVARRWLSGRRP